MMPRTIHIDLAAYGREGEWVDILDPRFLTPRQTREINDGGDGEAILRRIVSSWKIKSNESTLSDPSSDPLDDIENGLFAVIVEEFKALSGAALPKVSSRP